MEGVDDEEKNKESQVHVFKIMKIIEYITKIIDYK